MSNPLQPERSPRPWTAPDPQPGDFNAELAKLDPRYVEHHAGDPDAKLIVLVGVEGDAGSVRRIIARLITGTAWARAAQP